MINSLLRYLKLWSAFAKTSLLVKLEYKANFFLQIIVEIGWALVTVFALEIMFTQTDDISGWTKGEVFMIYAFYRLMSAMGAVIFRENIRELIVLVNSGNLDLLLTKPINTFVLVFTRHLAIDRFSQVLISLAVFYYATYILGLQFTLIKITLVIFLCLSGVFIRYGLSIIIHSLVFWLENLDNLERLELTLFGTARFPRQAFPPALRTAFTFVVPIMFAAAIPAEIFLGKSSPILLWITILLTSFISIFVYKFFFFALRHYSSASS